MSRTRFSYMNWWRMIMCLSFGFQLVSIEISNLPRSYMWSNVDFTNCDPHPWHLPQLFLHTLTKSRITCQNYSHRPLFNLTRELLTHLRSLTPSSMRNDGRQYYGLICIRVYFSSYRWRCYRKYLIGLRYQSTRNTICIAVVPRSLWDAAALQLRQ